MRQISHCHPRLIAVQYAHWGAFKVPENFGIPMIALSSARRGDLVMESTGVCLMGDPARWQSFWDLASPEHGAKQLEELYGPGAAKAASECAAAAREDDRDEDYRFWTAVFARLRPTSAPGE